jgi:hypothetical protein
MVGEVVVCEIDVDAGCGRICESADADAKSLKSWRFSQPIETDSSSEAHNQSKIIKLNLIFRDRAKHAEAKSAALLSEIYCVVERMTFSLQIANGTNAFRR